MTFDQFYRGKRVLVTGHTGFKGSWLVSWLLDLGAEIHGIALAPDQSPALFDQLELGSRLTGHHLLDVRDHQATAERVQTIKPDVVFHLAAQPLVRESYRAPVETFATNVMGTVHVLEGLRLLAASEHRAVAVLVTTDKCYENREWLDAYRESDPMGGHDPYSASKGSCELAIASYRRSFFGADSTVAVASARAGNVLGAGDWANDRIVPDAVRAWSQGQPLKVRRPRSTRPWQHVLEPLSGYLNLSFALHEARERGDVERLELLGGGMNFGPTLSNNHSVAALIEALARHWPGVSRWEDAARPDDPHEAGLLNLAIDKAWHALQWRPVWNFETTVARVARGYATLVERPDKAREVVHADLAAYRGDAIAAGVESARAGFR